MFTALPAAKLKLGYMLGPVGWQTCWSVAASHICFRYASQAFMPRTPVFHSELYDKTSLAARKRAMQLRDALEVCHSCSSICSTSIWTSSRMNHSHPKMQYRRHSVACHQLPALDMQTLSKLCHAQGCSLRAYHLGSCDYEAISSANASVAPLPVPDFWRLGRVAAVPSCWKPMLRAEMQLAVDHGASCTLPLESLLRPCWGMYCSDRKISLSIGPHC